MFLSFSWYFELGRLFCSSTLLSAHVMFDGDEGGRKTKEGGFNPLFLARFLQMPFEAPYLMSLKSPKSYICHGT